MSHVRNLLQLGVGTKIDARDHQAKIDVRDHQAKIDMRDHQAKIEGRDHQAKIDERDHLLCGCDPSLLIQCRVISKIVTHIMVSNVQPDPTYFNF